MTAAANEARAFYVRYGIYATGTNWPMREWGPPSLAVDGPVGLCWHNARSYASQDPTRYLYAEGVVWATGYPESHGWVVDRSDNSVIEVTSGYAQATRYRGMAFEVEQVERFLDVDDRRKQWRGTLDGVPYSEAPGVVDVLFDEVYDAGLTAAGFARALEGVGPVPLATP